MPRPVLPAVAETAIRHLIAVARRTAGERGIQPWIHRDLHEAVRAVETALRQYTANPEIIVYGNPPVGRVRRFGGGRVVGILSRDVHKMWYTHAETGEDHYHDFEPGDLLIAVEGGGQRDLVLTNEDGRPLWGEFD